MLSEIIKIAQQIAESGKIIGQKLSNIGTELTKPYSFHQGEIFEQFVEDNLFPDDSYELIRRTDTYERNQKRFAKSSEEPDRIFKCKITGQVFGVECKYRSRLTIERQLHWAKKYQMDRYKEIDLQDYPVFIAIGFGGTSSKPKELFFFPVRKEKYIKINEDRLANIIVPPEKIDTSFLQKILN